MSAGKLYTSYFANKKSKGIKVAVTRHKPQWLDFKAEGILNFSELAPSEELLNYYNNAKKDSDEDSEYVWFHFKRVFINERNNCYAMQNALDKIASILDAGKDVTLLCYENSDERCHRGLLANHFMQKGYDTEEL